MAKAVFEQGAAMIAAAGPSPGKVAVPEAHPEVGLVPEDNVAAGCCRSANP